MEPDYSIRFVLKRKYAVCTHQSRLIEAILMSTHNIHVQNKISANIYSYGKTSRDSRPSSK